MLHDSKLQRDDILIMDPVLCRTPHESVLVASSRCVSFNRVSSCSDEIEQLGELDDEVIIVHPVEWVGLEELLVEGWL
jgi:hypothetical protein